ncbi:uncharacterized protein DS421_16g544610 [Arachis hypogaea]|nr:uncharacterized protein DS421_16g544610 [Arachis hypogaea]
MIFDLIESLIRDGRMDIKFAQFQIHLIFYKTKWKSGCQVVLVIILDMEFKK